MFPVENIASAASIVKKSASVCLYEHHDQNGFSECFPYNEHEGQAWFNLHPIGWGDIVTSLYVPEGVSVRMYYDHNLWGGYQTYTGPY